MSAPFDVVIATKDRPDSLGSLLEDLRRARTAPGRVVVVDDSARAVPWGERASDLPLEVVRPTPGGYITRAKNLGWARCSAEYVAFVDDDNRLPPDLLDTLARDLTEHPNWGAVMPGVLYHRRPELVWVYAAPFRRDRWAFDLIGRNAPRDAGLENRFLPTDALPNLSMVRTEVLRALGGFDERLPVNSSADLCQRMKRASWEVRADTGVLTRHDVEPPGVPGYWAEHTVQNPERCRIEVADWFRFHRRWNGGGSSFDLRASYHAMGFVVPQILAAVIRPDGRPLPLLGAIMGGWREGLSSGRDPGFSTLS